MQDDLSKHVLMNAVMELLPKQELPDYREHLFGNIAEITNRAIIGEIEEHNITRKIMAEDDRIVLVHCCSHIVERRLQHVLNVKPTRLINVKDIRVAGRGLGPYYPIYHKSIFDVAWTRRYEFGMELDRKDSKTLQEVWEKYCVRKTELQKMIIDDEELVSLLQVYNDLLIIKKGNSGI